MKSFYMRTLCLGAAGLLVVSAASYGKKNENIAETQMPAAVSEIESEQSNAVEQLSQIQTRALISDEKEEVITMAAGVADIMTEALTQEVTAAEVSVTDAERTAGGQEEMVSVYGYQNLGIAVVDGNLNVREAAGTDASVVGKMPNHSACEILSTDGEWSQIQSGEVSGFVKSEYLVTGNEAAALAEQIKKTVAKVTTTTLYVREEPNTDCSIITAMPLGEELEVTEVLDGWVKVTIDSDEGYVCSDYIEILTELPTAMTMTEIRYGSGVSDVRVDLVAYACQFVGNPYVWGGTSLTKGADCSGFVLSVFANYGVSLPHSSVAQANCGTSISVSEAQPGDLIFYGNGKRINHVAIYIGNGQVVHASSPRSGIKISTYNYRNPVKVVRVLSN